MLTRMAAIPRIKLPCRLVIKSGGIRGLPRHPWGSPSFVRPHSRRPPAALDKPSDLERQRGGASLTAAAFDALTGCKPPTGLTHENFAAAWLRQIADHLVLFMPMNGSALDRQRSRLSTSSHLSK